MAKVLIGSINVAARVDGFPYISCGLPLCNSDGVEWEQMTPVERWSLCVTHLCGRDPKFVELYDDWAANSDEREAPNYILFGNNLAMRLVNAVQNECETDVMQLVSVQNGDSGYKEITWLCNQKDTLWDALFERKFIITKYFPKD
jgi:hypothetical protein